MEIHNLIAPILSKDMMKGNLYNDFSHLGKMQK